MDRIQALIDRFAADITARPVRWALLVALITGVALGGLRRFNFEDNPRAIFMGDDAESAYLQRLYNEFGPDDQDVLLCVKAEDIFDRKVLYAARNLAGAAAKVDGVDRVYSIFSLRKQGSDVVPLMPRRDAPAEQLRDAREEALRHPLAAGHFVSPDAKVMVIVVRLTGEPRSVAELTPPVEQIRRLARLTQRSAPVEVRLTGHPPLRIDTFGLLRRDQARFVVCSGVVAVILAAVMFQSLAAVLIVVLAPMVGVLWIVGAMSMLGLPINGINTVLPTLVFAIGLTDSIHLMIDLQRRRSAGVAREEAVADVLRTLAFPSLLTALTTATGLGSLSLAREPAIQSFGQTCAAGILVNFAAVITVFPLLACTRLGDWLTPRGRSFGLSTMDTDFSPLVQFITRHHKAIVVSHVIVGAILLAISMNLRSDINATEPIASNLESVVALKQMDENFGGGMFSYVSVQWPTPHRLDSPEVIDVLAKVHEAIERQPEFRGAFSIQNLLSASSTDKRPLEQRVRNLRQYPAEELRRLVRRDLQRLVVSFHVPDIGAAALRPAFERLNQELSEIEAHRPGFQFHITGTFYVVSQNLGNIMGDLQRSLAACSLLVFGVIGASLHSLRISIISLLPDMLPLLVTSSILVAFGEPLRVVSMLTFCLCFAISVDDTIHFLVRFQRARQTKSAAGAVEESFEEAGAGIVTGTVIVVGAFSIMMLSEMPSIRWFAVLSGLSMVAALETMLLLLPALLMTFDVAPTGDAAEADPALVGC